MYSKLHNPPLFFRATKTCALSLSKKYIPLQKLNSNSLSFLFLFLRLLVFVRYISLSELYGLSSDIPSSCFNQASTLHTIAH